MALPTVEKTWLYKVNTILLSTGVADTDWKNFWYTLKQALTTASGWTDASGNSTTHPAPWVVVRSRSNGAVDVDTWTDPTYLTYNTYSTARSWIVLRNGGNAGAVGGSNPIELCIDWANSGPYSCSSTISMASRGFDLTTGTTTTHPSINATPTGNLEVFLRDNRTSYNNTFQSINDAVSFTCVLHVMMTADGKSTRIFVTNGTGCYMHMLIEEAGQQVNGQDTANYAYWPSGIITYFYYNLPTVDRYTDYSYGQFTAKAANGVYKIGSAYFSTLFYGTNSMVENVTVPNDITGEYALTQIGIVGSSSGLTGRIGTLSDAWFGSTLLPTGDSYPADGTKQFVHFGNLVVPWNRSTLLVHP